MISFYAQETSYMKWKTNIAQWGVSIKINNENEKYILHFIFYTNFMDTCIEKRYQRTYQLVRRQDTSYMRISKEKNFLVYIDYLIEKI